MQGVTSQKLITNCAYKIYLNILQLGFPKRMNSIILVWM